MSGPGPPPNTRFLEVFLPSSHDSVFEDLDSSLASISNIHTCSALASEAAPNKQSHKENDYNVPITIRNLKPSPTRSCLTMTTFDSSQDSLFSDSSVVNATVKGEVFDITQKGSPRCVGLADFNESKGQELLLQTQKESSPVSLPELESKTHHHEDRKQRKKSGLFWRFLKSKNKYFETKPKTETSSSERDAPKISETGGMQPSLQDLFNTSDSISRTIQSLVSDEEKSMSSSRSSIIQPDFGSNPVGVVRQMPIQPRSNHVESSNGWHAVKPQTMPEKVNVREPNKATSFHDQDNIQSEAMNEKEEFGRTDDMVSDVTYEQFRNMSPVGKDATCLSGCDYSIDSNDPNNTSKNHFSRQADLCVSAVEDVLMFDLCVEDYDFGICRG